MSKTHEPLMRSHEHYLFGQMFSVRDFQQGASGSEPEMFLDFLLVHMIFEVFFS